MQRGDKLIRLTTKARRVLSIIALAMDSKENPRDKSGHLGARVDGEPCRHGSGGENVAQQATNESDPWDSLDTAQKLHKLKSVQAKVRFFGDIILPPPEIDTDSLAFDEEHVSKGHPGTTKEDAIRFIKNADFSASRKSVDKDGETWWMCYISRQGAAYVDVREGIIRTVFPVAEYKGSLKLLVKGVWG